MGTMKQKLSQMNPLLKGVIFFVGGLLILLIVLQILVSLFADDIAAGYLKDKVKKSSDGTYVLDFKDFDLNVFRGSATISQLRIEADTTAFTDTSASNKPARMLVTGTVGELDVSGVNVFAALWGDELHIGTITLNEPDIQALRNHHKIPGDTTTNHSASLDSSIYAAVSKKYDALEIEEIDINKGRVIFSKQADTLSRIDQANLTLENIRIDSASARSGRRFITDDIALDAFGFSHKLSDSLNTVKFKHLTISSDKQRIKFDSLQLVPRYPRFEFSQVKGRRTDWLDLDIPELGFEGFDFASYIDSGRIYAKHLEMNNPHMVDFLNKAYPGGPPEKDTLPNSSFKNSSQPIKIDSLTIKNAFISYSEYLSQAPRAGTLTFEQLNATFYDISNYEEDIRKGLTTTLEVRTRVMGTGLLTIHYEFPMDTQNGFHTIKGTLHKMDMTDFNQMLEYVAFVRIDSGQLHSMEFDMTLDADRSNGNVIMMYENLKISILDKKTIQQEGLLKNLMTFVANNFVVNRHNTPEEGMEPGRIQFERSKYKSIFNYWWKSLLSGIKDSIK